MKNIILIYLTTKKITERKKMIYELLDTGKENALSTEYLKQALGFRDVRSLRKQVETERLNGKIIISSSGAGIISRQIVWKSKNL